MKILNAIFLMSIIACSGCTQIGYWYNENRTYQQASTACWDCLYQAQRQAAEVAAQQSENIDKSSPEVVPTQQMLFEQCMRQRGYEKTWDYKIEYNVRKGHIEYGNKTYYIAGK